MRKFYFFKAFIILICCGLSISQSYSQCSGIPTAGSVSPASQTICASTNLILNLSGQDVSTGIVLQWQISLDGGSTFSNLTGETSSSLTAINPSVGNLIYRCKVTCSNTNDSAFSSSANITVTPGIDILPNVLSNTTCIGACDGLIDVNVTGGDGVFFFNWSDGSTNEDIMDLCSGIYTINVSDLSGCSNSEDFLINEPLELTTIINDGTICTGDTLILDAITSGGTGTYTTNWFPTSDLVSSVGPQVGAFPANTTVYTATVTDANGCISTSTATITVNPLPTITATLASGGSINQGATDTLFAGGGIAYMWNDGSSNFSTNDTVVITPLTTTNYTVVGADVNGCENSTSINLTVIPGALSISAVATDVTCFGGFNGSADLTVMGGASPFTYSWSNGSLTEDITGLNAGTYFVTVIDAAQDTQTTSVTILEPSQLILSQTSLTNVVCGSTSGEISINISGGVQPYSINWSNGQTTATIDSLSAGIYSVSVTDSNSCFASDAFNVLDQYLNSSIHGTAILQGNFLNAGTAYLYEITDTTAYLLKDSALLNSFGEFDFSVGFASNFIVSVKPDQVLYPNTLTTFFGDVYRWSDADTVNTLCASGDTIGINVFSFSDSTGTGFISGVLLDITDTTNQRRPGEPIRGIDIILEDVPGGNSISQRTTTDSNGEYSFSNVRSGNYQLFVQIPGCQMINTYQISISGTNSIINRDFFVDSLDGFIDTTLAIPLQVCGFNSAFSASTVCIGDTTLFTDLSTGVPTAITGYQWDFDGNGVVDDTTKANVLAVFNTAGTFNATLVLFTYDSLCFDTAQVTVTVNDLPRVVVTPDTMLCSRTALNLYASGALSYVWNTDTLISDLTNDTVAINTNTAFTKDFIVTGTDINGCSNADTASITTFPTPYANFIIEENNICLGSIADFRDTSLNVPVGSTYAWDFNNDGVVEDTTSGSISFQYADDGGYNVELSITSPNGCSDSLYKAITIRPNPIDVSAGFDKSLICGASTNMNAYSNTAGVTYLWTPNYYLNNPFIANPAATPDTTTSYVVKATKDGCSDYDTIVVNVTPLSIDAGLDKDIVCGNSTTINATSNGVTGTLYQWTPGEGLSSQTKINPTASPFETTTYVVTAYKNTCIATDTVTVNVTPMTVSAGSDKTIICGQSATISATSPGSTGVTWVWSPSLGVANPSIANTTTSPSQTTQYVLTGTKGNCVSIDTLKITVTPFTVSAGVDKTIDCGSSTQLQSSSFYTSGTSYLWTPSTGLSNPLTLSPSASPETTTNYLLTVTKGSCVSTDSVKVSVNHAIPLAFSADKTIFSNKYPPYTVKFTNNTPNSTGYVFTWNFGDSTALITSKNYTYSYQKAGVFSVSLYAQNLSGGCKDTLTYTDYIVAWTPTAVPSLLAENHEIEVYPNPGNGIATIDLSNSEIKEGLISVSNISGQVVYSNQIKIGTDKLVVNLNDLESGVYFIKIESESTVVVKRYVKE